MLKAVWLFVASIIIFVIAWFFGPVSDLLASVAIFSYLAMPIKVALQLRFVKGENVSSLVSMLILALMVTFIVLAVTPIILGCIKAIYSLFANAFDLRPLAHSIQSYMNMAENLYKNFSPEKLLEKLKNADIKSLRSSFTRFAGLAGNLISLFAGSGAGLLSAITKILMFPIMSFFVIKNWNAILSKLAELIPKNLSQRVCEVCADINRNLIAYLNGQFLVCCIMSVVYTIGFLAIGLPKSFSLGLLCGFLTFIPFLGWATGFLLSTITNIEIDNTIQGFLPIALLFISSSVLESQLLTPILLGRKLKIHPIFIIFGMVSLSYRMGPIGLMFAIPIISTIDVIIKAALQTYFGSSIYGGVSECR